MNEREYIYQAGDDPLAEGQEATFTDRFGTYAGIVESVEVFEYPDGARIVKMKTREVEEEPEGPSSR